MCYAEQDRCVVPVYADVKEEFFPDCKSLHSIVAQDNFRDVLQKWFFIDVVVVLQWYQRL